MTINDMLRAAVAGLGHELHVGPTREEWLALRRQDVTASAVGALLNVHDFLTPFGLYQEKIGAVNNDGAETGAMKRGRLLEPVALALLAEQQETWTVLPGGVYVRDPASRRGATPDAFATRPETSGFGIVQIKSVASGTFRKKWKDADGQIEPPLWIALQAMQEAALTGATWAAVAALVVDYDIALHVIEVPIRPGVIARLKEETLRFWDRVETQDPPPADYERDARLIADLYGQDDGATIDLTGDNALGDILARREALKVIEAQGAAAAKERKPLDAEITVKMGSARFARAPGGRVIENKTIKRNGYVVEPSSYRTLSVKTVAASKEAAE